MLLRRNPNRDPAPGDEADAPVLDREKPACGVVGLFVVICFFVVAVVVSLFLLIGTQTR